MHSLPATPRPTALLYGRSPTRHLRQHRFPDPAVQLPARRQMEPHHQHCPRGLIVFDKVKRTVSSTALVSSPAPLQLWNGTEHDAVTGQHTVIDGLGHSGKAIYLGKGGTVEYEYRNFRKDSLTVEVCLVPTMP